MKQAQQLLAGAGAGIFSYARYLNRYDDDNRRQKKNSRSAIPLRNLKS